MINPHSITADKLIGIYKITSPSGKIYIGQSWDIEQRKKTYNNGNVPNQRLLYHSLRKYGFENHKFEIIHAFCNEIAQDVLDKYERYYWNVYKDDGNSLLNIKEPGCGIGRHSDETKKRIGIGNKGKLKGVKFSKERVEKLKVRLTGNKHRLGTKVSEKTKKHMSEIMTGRKFSDQHIAASRAASKLRQVPIIQYSLDGIFIKEWESSRQASKELNIYRSGIRACAKGRYKTSGGFIWKYKV
jgi:group I intron endonuclease